MSARAAVGVLAITHAVAIGGGYLLAPKVLIDEEVKHEGFFQIDTTKILSTTVESLREENRLLIYSYKGGAKVQAERTRFWLFDGRQELNVPAVVNYYLNLSVSIGVQKGPPIGVQKGPPSSSSVTGMTGAPFALVAA